MKDDNWENHLVAKLTFEAQFSYEYFLLTTLSGTKLIRAKPIVLINTDTL